MRDLPHATSCAFESTYLPQVLPVRAQLDAGVRRLVGGLEQEADTLAFVVQFIAVRIGCLRDIPNWLRASASACEASSPAVAAELRDAAALEQLDRLLLMEDLVELHALVPGMSLGRLVRGPFDARIERHARMRALVPVRDEPALALAVDLELAEFGRVFGLELVRACQRNLPAGIGVCRFIRARLFNLDERIAARRERLVQQLRERPERAGSWARVGREVCASYLDCLEACAPSPRYSAGGVGHQAMNMPNTGSGSFAVL